MANGVGQDVFRIRISNVYIQVPAETVDRWATNCLRVSGAAIALTTMHFVKPSAVMPTIVGACCGVVIVKLAQRIPGFPSSEEIGEFAVRVERAAFRFIIQGRQDDQ
jgi:hypothetical protein